MRLWTEACPRLSFVELPAKAKGEGLLPWLFGSDRRLWIREDRSMASFGATTLGAGARRQLVFNPLRSSGSWLVSDLCHELGHVLGLKHEHQRRDRDLYIAYPPDFLESLSRDRRADYELDPNYPPAGFDWPYDYDSIMHYSSNVDGNRARRRDDGSLIAGRKGPSAGDAERLRLLYGPP